MSDQADLQAKVQKLQTMSHQMQQVAQQKAQLEAMRRDGQAAMEALEGLDGDAQVYRSIGSLLIQDKRDDAVARIKDELETSEIRIKRAKDQQDQLKAALDKLQGELQAAFAKSQDA